MCTQDIYIYSGCGCRTQSGARAQCLDAIISGRGCSRPRTRESRTQAPCPRHGQQSSRVRSQSRARYEESSPSAYPSRSRYEESSSPVYPSSRRSQSRARQPALSAYAEPVHQRSQSRSRRSERDPYEANAMNQRSQIGSRHSERDPYEAHAMSQRSRSRPRVAATDPPIVAPRRSTIGEREFIQYRPGVAPSTGGREFNHYRPRVAPSNPPIVAPRRSTTGAHDMHHYRPDRHDHNGVTHYQNAPYNMVEHRPSHVDETSNTGVRRLAGTTFQHYQPTTSSRHTRYSMYLDDDNEEVNADGVSRGRW